jgi:hypothetical protein
MIDPALRASLPLGRSSQRCTVVLQWESAPDAGALTRGATKRERLENLQAFYRTMKAPVLDILRQNDDVEVQDMPITGEAVITASTEKLNALLANDGPLARVPKLRVLANASFSLP